MATSTASIITPVGEIGIQCTETQLLSACFLPTTGRNIAPESPFAKAVCQQLKHYFADPKHKFQVPLHLAGTALQQSIWQFLISIPSGVTMTYGEVAAKLGTHPRVIGQACRANPVLIIVPCHRVLAVQGLGGYCGSTKEEGLNRKRYLLQHEKTYLRTEEGFD